MGQSRTTDANLAFFSEDQVINIRKGPQFKTRGGPALAAAFLFLLVFSVIGLLINEYLVSLICFLLCIPVFSLVLDIKGIEYDKSLHQIKDYKLFLWFRIGQWKNIHDFTSIYLTNKDLVVATSEYSGGTFDTYHYYYIKLVDEVNNKEILLAEYKNYYKALQISKGITDATGLKFKDFVKGRVNAD